MVSRRFGPVSIMISLGYLCSVFLSISLCLVSCPLCLCNYVFLCFRSCLDDLLVSCFHVHVHFQFIPYLHAVYIFLSFSYFIYFVHTIFSWSLDKLFIHSATLFHLLHSV